MKGTLLMSGLILFTVPAYAGGAQKICFDNGGVADYRADGSYEYSGGGQTYTGKWKSVGKNRYQINFDNGNSRVDTYEMKGGTVIDHAPQGTFTGHAC